MSEEEENKLFEKIDKGLALSYERLLRRKAALGQDMVIADEQGQPITVPAAVLLAKQLISQSEGNNPEHANFNIKH